MADFLATLFDAVGAEPALFFIALLCTFAAGILAGCIARSADDRADDCTPAMPLHTTNSSLVDLQARRALANGGVRPHARAGRSPLKPSYDGRKHEAANHQATDSPRA